MEEEKPRKEQNSSYCVFVIIITQWTMALTMGINVTALNPALEVIGRFINETYIERYSQVPSEGTVTSLVVVAQSGLAWGSFAGSLLVRVVIDKSSRKGGVAISHALNLVSVVLMSPVAKFGKTYEALIAGRFLNGIARGFGYSVVAVVVAETTCRRRLSTFQGPYTYLIFIGGAIGVALGHSKVVGNSRFWPLLTASSAPLSILYLLAYPWLPQTVGYLLIEGEKEKAKQTLQKLRKGSTSTFETELRNIEREISADSKVQAASVWTMFRDPDYRRQIVAAVLTMCCTQFVGTQAIFFYSDTLFIEAGVPEEYVTYASIGIFAQCIIPGLLAIVLIRRIGSRKVFLIGTSISGTGLLIFTVATALKATAPGMPYLALAAAIFSLFGNYLGIQITLFTLTSEITTQITRPAAVLVGSVVYWTTACLVGTVLPYSLEAWGAYAYIPFVVGALGEFLFGLFSLPETFKKSVEEIQAKLRRQHHSSVVEENPNDVNNFTNPAYDET